MLGRVPFVGDYSTCVSGSEVVPLGTASARGGKPCQPNGIFDSRTACGSPGLLTSAYDSRRGVRPLLNRALASKSGSFVNCRRSFRGFRSQPPRFFAAVEVGFTSSY